MLHKPLSCNQNYGNPVTCACSRRILINRKSFFYSFTSAFGIVTLYIIHTCNIFIQQLFFLGQKVSNKPYYAYMPHHNAGSTKEQYCVI